MRGERMKVQGESEAVAGKASSGEDDDVQIGELTPFERRLVRRAGYLLSCADLLWIAQAALIALCLSSFVSSMGSTLTVPQLLGYAGVLIVLAAVRQILNLSAGKFSRRAARLAKSRVRTTLLYTIARISPAHPLPSSGEIAATLTEQVDALGPYFSHFYPQQTRLKLVPLGILAVTFWVSWLAALILLLTGPMIPFFMALIGMRAKVASARQQDELTRMSGFLLDRVRGLQTLRLFGALDTTQNEIERVGETFRVGTMRVLRIAFLSSTVLELFSALGIAFVAVFVGFSLLGDIETGTWGAPLSFAAGLFVLLLAPEYFAPLRAYAAAYHDRAAGLAAKEKLHALHVRLVADALPSDFGENAGGNSEKTAMAPHGNVPEVPEITFDHVSLSLAGRQILSDFSLQISPGDTVILKGQSGAGKTTLLDCLLGLHCPDEGAILVDGKPQLNADQRNWRQSVSWIGQAPRLFHGSLRSNLMRANDQASHSDMMSALELAGARELVARLPRGLDTIIGEDGFGLSVGEIRRIALARAALRRNAGLILADEPTAGLDAKTAEDVIAGLKEISKGRTFVLATHDPKLMELTGRTVVLDAGHLSEVVA